MRSSSRSPIRALRSKACVQCAAGHSRWSRGRSMRAIRVRMGLHSGLASPRDGRLHRLRRASGSPRGERRARRPDRGVGRDGGAGERSRRAGAGVAGTLPGPRTSTIRSSCSRSRAQASPPSSHRCGCCPPTDTTSSRQRPPSWDVTTISPPWPRSVGIGPAGERRRAGRHRQDPTGHRVRTPPRRRVGARHLVRRPRARERCRARPADRRRRHRGPDRRGRTPCVAVLDHLRDRRALMILDNCEHVTMAVARLVDELLRACPASPSWRRAANHSACGVNGSGGFAALVVRTTQPSSCSATEPASAVTLTLLCGPPSSRSASSSTAFRSAIELAAARCDVLTPAEILDSSRPSAELATQQRSDAQHTSAEPRRHDRVELSAPQQRRTARLSSARRVRRRLWPRGCDASRRR